MARERVGSLQFRRRTSAPISPLLRFPAWLRAGLGLHPLLAAQLRGRSLRPHPAWPRRSSTDRRYSDRRRAWRRPPRAGPPPLEVSTVPPPVAPQPPVRPAAP